MQPPIHSETLAKRLACQAPIACFNNLPSTNDFLKDHPPREDKYVCLAEQQTQGRGQQGNFWYSPAGKNIYCSLFYRFPKADQSLTGLSILTGLAVIQAIKQLALQTPEITFKWPNDIYVADKKLAGILVELIKDKQGNSCAVIGIGLNVNSTMAETPLHATATSLCDISGKQLDRELVTAALIDHTFLLVDQFVKQGFAPFLPTIGQYDYLANKQIKINTPQGPLSGEAQGINSDGALLLKLDSDEIIPIYSGHITNIN